MNYNYFIFKSKTLIFSFTNRLHLNLCIIIFYSKYYLYLNITTTGVFAKNKLYKGIQTSWMIIKFVTQPLNNIFEGVYFCLVQLDF